MITSVIEYKRSRPLLGTYFNVTISGQSLEDAPNPVVNGALAEAARLEQIFSLYSNESILTLVNKQGLDIPTEVPKEFYYLLKLALRVWAASDGAFNPFFPKNIGRHLEPYVFADQDECFLLCKRIDVPLDLNGIAKGYVVDRVVERITRELPHVSGVVNAGGDLKFFNTQKKCVNLRLGDPRSPVLRTIVSPMNCVATSSIATSLYNENSSSQYSLQLRRGLAEFDTVSVAANCCCIADSLTKVALYGEPESIEKSANLFNAKILVFDKGGSVIESYGDQ